ncbi:M48 family metallopeptidase [Actinokineospora auranticolor]|uniref:Zn-dependent protease with chaperone function n=1 Tax=Actinokineospora auranticolor TaxID=155976 RepID=A0A2S6GPA4_9PSEU|nr:M48 family metallopeptidase [Actinokineospora auranticolor]PPK67064.1 Zn-dependent protease with chaperone function [Actinokineospora auranticolor]
MSVPVRSFTATCATAVALPMLVVFPLVAVAAIVAMVGLVGWFLVDGHLMAAVGAGLVFLPAAWAMAAALAEVARHPTEHLVGLPVTARMQPRLWAFVARVADEVGTPPPDEIRLIPEANAGSTELTRLLGLSVRRRVLYLGAPLLAGLTEKQLAAVVAQTLGYYRARGGKLSGLAISGRAALSRAHEHMAAERATQRLVKRLFGVYSRAYDRLTAPVGRRQQLVADAISARIAGSAAAESALLEVHVVAGMWDLFLSRHVTVAWRAGYLPDSVFDGFAAMRAAPELYGVLEEIRQRVGADTDTDPDDISLSRALRIAAIRAIDAPAPDSHDAPAVELLLSGPATLDRALLLVMDPAADAKKRVDWPTLRHIGLRDRYRRDALRLLKVAGRVMDRPPSLGTVLDAIDADRLDALAPADGGPDAGPRARREYAREVVGRELYGLVLLAFADSGQARWGVDWSGREHMTTGRLDLAHMHGIVQAAVAADGGTGSLRENLTAAGITTGFRPTKKLP